MTLQDCFKRGMKGLRDLFFPRLCFGCEELLEDDEQFLCQNCIDHLPITPTLSHRQNSVENLFWDIRKLERAGGYLYYYGNNSIVRRIVHSMKYHNQPQLAEYMGYLAGQEMLQTGFTEGVDLIVPIPLHKKKERERGYNQSELLCDGISRATGIPVDTTHLVRTRYTDTQTHKSYDERKLNLEDAFTVVQPQAWRGKHILLVDDVITTGSTMRECIKHISSIRLTRISIFGLALSSGVNALYGDELA